MILVWRERVVPVNFYTPQNFSSNRRHSIFYDKKSWKDKIFPPKVQEHLDFSILQTVNAYNEQLEDPNFS